MARASNSRNPSIEYIQLAPFDFLLWAGRDCNVCNICCQANVFSALFLTLPSASCYIWRRSHAKCPLLTRKSGAPATWLLARARRLSTLT